MIVGFAVTSWFLSMWISNVASMTLMLPIVEAILVQMETTFLTSSDDEASVIQLEEKPLTGDESDTEKTVDDVTDVTKPQCNGDRAASNSKSKCETNAGSVQITACVVDIESMTSHKKKRLAYFADVAKALTLSITYAGKCGGMATLTGTPANMIMKSQVDE